VLRNILLNSFMSTSCRSSHNNLWLSL